MLLKNQNKLLHSQSGFVIDIMACLPYDLLHNFIGTSYTDIFSILKVRNKHNILLWSQKQHNIVLVSFLKINR